MTQIDTSSLNLDFDPSSLNGDLDGTFLKSVAPAGKASASLDDATTADGSSASNDASASNDVSGSDHDSGSDGGVPPYEPVTPMSVLEEQYAWVTQASVEDVSYVLIILVDMIFIMSYYSLQVNDISNIMATETPMTSDLTTIADELSTLQSSIVYDSDTGDYTSDGSFTSDDAVQLSDAINDLFLTNSGNSLTWDDMAIEWDGTTYYMQPDGTWSTTSYGDSEENGNYGVTGDSSVSDAGLYEFANAQYAVDKASYTGGSLDTSVVFPTTSPYDNPNDPIMSSLGELWGALNTPVAISGGGESSIIEGMEVYGNTGNPENLQAVLAAYGQQDANSMASGGGSDLDNLITLTNNALTQVGNVSTQQTNEIQQLTQELETMDQLAQTIIQDATKANENMVSHQVV